MEIKEIETKQTWEDFLFNCQGKTFLQSWAWGEFSQNMGEKIWRLGVYDNGQLRAAGLAEKKETKRGVFLLVPHGPVTPSTDRETKTEIMKTLTAQLKEIAFREKASFIRINPIWERIKENEETFQALGFRPAPLQMHPEASWKLDISLPEEELFSAFRKTTRYLIRQAQKNERIRTVSSDDFKDVESFSQLHQQTSLRQRFVPFSREYLQKEFSAFAKDDAVRLFFACYDQEIAAGSFVVFWSGIGFYHHAASLPQYAKLSLPYLLQWEAIREAKNKGCRLYDFWGFVDPAKHPSHPWAGPTLFKMGFGGLAREYVKTQDLVLSPKYWLTYTFEKVRKLKRGL